MKHAFRSPEHSANAGGASDPLTDWDAARYDRISAPQFDWGRRVVGRLNPVPGERILDLGCGTGRLTQHILAAIGHGQAVGIDQSAAMLAVARAAAAEEGARGVAYVQGTGVALPFKHAFDAVFSAATLHWIPGHAAVFESVFDALRAGGRFVAQCGGKGNLQRLLERTALQMASPLYEGYFRGWREPWFFADPETTASSLRGVGFIDVQVWLEEAPVDLATGETYAEFVSCVCIRHHLARLPLSLRDRFVGELTERAARDHPPFVLDYWRLNIAGRKAAS